MGVPWVRGVDVKGGRRCGLPLRTDQNSKRPRRASLQKCATSMKDVTVGLEVLVHGQETFREVYDMISCSSENIFPIQTSTITRLPVKQTPQGREVLCFLSRRKKKKEREREQTSTQQNLIPKQKSTKTWYRYDTWYDRHSTRTYQCVFYVQVAYHVHQLFG